MSSEAYGDAEFASFAANLISKEHDYKQKKDKLEYDVCPREIEHVIIENRDDSSEEE